MGCVDPCRGGGLPGAGRTPQRLIVETVDEPGPGQLATPLAIAIARPIKAADPLVATHCYVTSCDLKDPAVTAPLRRP